MTVWTGPTEALHDIQRDGDALEVKGTLNREGVTVEIHGLRQLEAPAGGTLHLVVHRLEHAAAQGISVPDLVRSVIDLGVSRHEFVRLLGRYGYDMADEEETPSAVSTILKSGCTPSMKPFRESSAVRWLGEMRPQVCCRFATPST